MKELKWDDSIEDPTEFLDAGLMPLDEDSQVKIVASAGKSHITELRRRIEERLDGKRIDHDFEYEEIDDLIDSMQ